MKITTIRCCEFQDVLMIKLLFISIVVLSA